VFTTTGETPVSGFGKVKACLDDRLNKMRKDDGLGAMMPWTLHDLRRTMVTVMNETLGVPPHVVEAVVNHMRAWPRRVWLGSTTELSTLKSGNARCRAGPNT
jgi:hypothetical protein